LGDLTSEAVECKELKSKADWIGEMWAINSTRESKSFKEAFVE